jgi:hypothetical protein
MPIAKIEVCRSRTPQEVAAGRPASEVDLGFNLNV